VESEDRILGTHFTCFTGTKVQILTQKVLLDDTASAQFSDEEEEEVVEEDNVEEEEEEEST
jgi:hypothetical protein